MTTQLTLDHHTGGKLTGLKSGGVWFVTVLALFLAVSAQATSYTNNASGNWGDAGSWANNAVGVSGSDTIIWFNNTNAVAWSSTNNNAGAFVLNGLRLVTGSKGVNLYPSGGSSLLFTNSSGGILPTITGVAQVLYVYSPITLATNLTINHATPGGTIRLYGGIDGTGDITLQGSSTIALSGIINNSGSITNSGINATLAQLSGCVISNHVKALVQNSTTSKLSVIGATAASADATFALNILAGDVQWNSTANLNTNIVLAISPTGVFELQSSSVTIAGINDGAGGGGLVWNNTPQTTKDLVFGGTDSYSFSGQINDSSVTTMIRLTQSGSGTQTLGGSNSFSGGMTVSGGTLKLAHSHAVPNSTVTLSGGAVVFDSSVSGNAFNFGGLAAASAGPGYNMGLTNNAGTAIALTVGGNNASTTYAGVLSGAGSLNKLGTGTLTLTGTNTYTGPTEILGGALTIGGAGQLGNGNYAGALSNNAALVYGSTATQTLSGVISGTGSLTQQAGGLLLNGVNTYSGVTTVSGGSLGGTGTISGPVSVSAGFGVLAPSLGTGGSNTLNLASTLTLNSGLNLKFALLPSGTVTNDQIAIAGALTLNGVNYVTLSFPGGPAPIGTYTLMTYNGTNGTGSIALGASYPNAALTYDNTKVTLTVSGGNTSAGSTLTWKGNLDGNWVTANNWTNMAGSAVTYSDGNAVTFDQNASRFNVTGTVAAVSPSSVTISNSTAYTIRANIGGNGYLSKNGSSGTATLTGTNSYTGPTFVIAGTLTIGGAGQLGDGNYAGVITHNGAALNFASSAPNTLSGGITKGVGAAAPVISSGTGLLTLSGVNSISTLTVSTGTTVIANTTTLSSLATVGSVANSPATLILSNGTVTGITTLTVGNIANANTNGVRVTGGSLLEVNTSITLGNASSTGNTLTNSGGVLQFSLATPPITVSPNNTFVITNGTVSFRSVNPVNLTNNWVNSGIGTNTVAWQGNNTLRLDGSTATNTLARPYEFNSGTGFGPTNYVNLELLNTSFVKGNEIVIGTNGTMTLVSGATAVLSGVTTNYGTLAGSGMVSGLVAMASGSVLSPAGMGMLSFSSNLTFTGTSTYNWNYTSSTCSVVQVGGNLTLPGTINLNITGSNALPANPVLFTWQGAAPSLPTWNITPSGKYKVTQSGNSVVLSESSGGLLLLIN